MSGAADLQSGKGHKDENFPVASFLIAPRHRAAGAGLLPFRARRRRCRRSCHRARRRKSCALLEADARQPGGRERCGRPKAWRLRDDPGGARPVAEHALDLLEAFRRDCHQAALSRLGRSDRLLPLLAPCRWAALCWTCMAKAGTPGRPMMRCAPRLQIINHLQDCAKDYRELNRVYIPEDAAGRRGHRASTALARGRGQIRPWRA